MKITNNIELVHEVSNNIGISKEDMQLFNIARSYNTYLKLDSEALLFALAKGGISLNIYSLFSAGDKNIRKTVENAIINKIIPDSIDIDFQLMLFINKLYGLIESWFDDIIGGTGDLLLESTSGETRKKIILKIIDYTYNGKIIDELFFDELFPSPDDIELKERIKRLFNYKDICYGNNLFIKQLVVNGKLSAIENLILKTQEQIEQIIDNAPSQEKIRILTFSKLPGSIRLKTEDIGNSSKVTASIKAYAKYIFGKLEKIYATEHILLQFVNLDDVFYNVFNVEGNNTMYVFKNTLIDPNDKYANELLMDSRILENGLPVKFNIEKHIIRDYVNKLPEDSAFLTETLNPAGFRKEDFLRIFGIIQRLYYLTKTDKFNTIKKLIEKKYLSAYDIIKAGSANFNSDLYELDEPTRNYIYNAAEIKVNKVLAFFLKYSTLGSNTLTTEVIKSNTAAIVVTQMSELSELFEGQDVTDTDHCESVFGPAAYLVDLLNLMKQIKVEGSDKGDNLYTIVNKRRSDIPKIPLNCKNSLTLVPYIDLVIEILEERIKPLNADLKWDTTKDEEDLKANPEYCCYDAYVDLKSNYSWIQMPFDLINEEIRLYLKTMGFDRSTWAELHLYSDSDVNNVNSPGFEVLGFNPYDKIFFGNINLNSTSEPYSKVITDIQYEIDPLEGYFYRINVKKFLGKTKFSLEYFMNLLDSYHINPTRYQIHYKDQMKLENAYLEFLSLDISKKFVFGFYQYYRLLKATNWSIPLLDAVLKNVVVNDSLINLDHIEKIGKIKKIQNTFNLSEANVAMLFGEINSNKYMNNKSYVDNVFLDNDAAEEFKKIFLQIAEDVNTSEFYNQQAYYADGGLHPFMRYVADVLQLSDEDMQNFKFLFLSDNNKYLITKAGLLGIVRAAYIMSVFGISSLRLIAYMKLFNISKLDMDVIFRCFDELPLFKEQKINTENILFLLKRQELIGTTISLPKEEDLTTTARNLLAVVQSKKDVIKTPDVIAELKKKLITELQKIEKFDYNILALIADNLIAGKDFLAYMNDMANNSTISIEQYDKVWEYIKSKPTTDPSIWSIVQDELHQETAELLNKKSNDPIVVDIVNTFVTAPANFKEQMKTTLAKQGVTDTTETTEYKVITTYYDTKDFINTQEPLDTQFISKKKEEFKDYLVNSLKISSTAAEQIKKIFFGEITNETLAHYLDEASAISSIKTKLATLWEANRFVKEVQFNFAMTQSYVQANAKPVNIYNILHADNIEGYRQLLWLTHTRKGLKNPDTIAMALYNYIIKPTPSTTDYVNAFNLFNWNAELFTITPEFFDRIPHEPIRALRALYEMSRVGVFGINPQFISTWIKSAGLNKTQVDELKTAAQNKLGIETYRQKATALRNVLRIKQRDALANYIIATNTTSIDENDLFSYFLIDTQMTPAMFTSRIVQATLALQLMVQRVQFHLEGANVSIDPDGQNLWKWMSLYRVWEANRKIFVYPENWLEPELREDKTNFFKEMEKELNSNEVNQKTVETAFKNYFNKFEKVANLEYLQTFVEEKNGLQTIHVLARTRNNPRELFYRRFEDSNHWTTWEPVGVQIESDNILLLLENDRLFIIWLEFSEKKDDEIIYLYSQFNWIENKNGIWTEKKSCSEKTILYYIHEVFYALILDVKESTNLFYDVTNEGTFLCLSYNRYLQNLWFPIILQYVTSSIKFDNDLIIKPAKVGASFSEVYNFKKPLYKNYLKKQKFTPVDILTIYIPFRDSFGRKDYTGIADVGYSPSPVSIIYPLQGLPNLKLPGNINLFECTHQVYPVFLENSNKSVFVLPVTVSLQAREMQQRCFQAATQDNFSIEILSEIPMSAVQTNKNSRFDYMVHKTNTNTNTTPYFTEQQADHILMVENGNESLYQTNTIDENGNTNGQGENTTGDLVFNKIKIMLAFHPFIDIMRKTINVYGIQGLMDPGSIMGNSSQLLKITQGYTTFSEEFYFNSDITKIDDNLVEGVFLKEKFDFDLQSPYGNYNWELFFHVPYMLASKLYTTGKYDEALQWINYIFDPKESNGEDEKRYWKFKPFRDEVVASQSIDQILFDINNTPGEHQEEKSEFERQIDAWSRDPFKPHSVAKMRPVAYMKATVMLYLDILIARGDKSFRTDTMESVNEALQYYVIAAQILGAKPDVIKTHIYNAMPFESFQNANGSMGNAMDTIEELFIKPENAKLLEDTVEANELFTASMPYSNDSRLKLFIQNLYANLQQVGSIKKLYFDVPMNTKLFYYWDLVADRLFKIRNSINIDGVQRSLSLFAPPIDPGMLAAAAAAGMDINALVNGDVGPASHYRFRHILAQATELCNELRSLSGQLLAAYEKEDNEIINQLRSQHEILLSEQVSNIRKKALDEALVQIQQLNKQLEAVEYRRNYYATRKYQNTRESQQLTLLDDARILQARSQALKLSASIAAAMPQMTSTGPQFGGIQLYNIANAISEGMSIFANISSAQANSNGILASYDRRQDDWKFQADAAKMEAEPLKLQKLAAEIRRDMAQYELQNHYMQINQSRETYEVLTTKYSNNELYNWMRKEISELQRMAYNMAYKLAKYAEKAYAFELSPGTVSRFISPDHSDSKYGMMFSGEKLYQELKKMEIAYYENNKRKLELVKHISLAILDPVKIIELRNTGTCQIIIPEVLFELDHPSHFNRRIKGVRLSMPCVTGPYTSVSAELTLTSNQFRSKNNQYLSGQPLIVATSTSSSDNDSGTFEFNFNDERYLPFEGAGVDSKWTLTLPNAVKQFDYNSINDVILSIHYTAENSGTSVDLIRNLKDQINQGKFGVLIDVNAQYPDAFEKIKNGQSAEIVLKNSMLPGFLQNLNIEISSVDRYDDNSSVTNITVNDSFNNKSLSLAASTANTIMLIVYLKIETSN